MLTQMAATVGRGQPSALAQGCNLDQACLTPLPRPGLTRAASVAHPACRRALRRCAPPAWRRGETACRSRWAGVGFSLPGMGHCAAAGLQRTLLACTSDTQQLAGLLPSLVSECPILLHNRLASTCPTAATATRCSSPMAACRCPLAPRRGAPATAAASICRCTTPATRQGTSNPLPQQGQQQQGQRQRQQRLVRRQRRWRQRGRPATLMRMKALERRGVVRCSATTHRIWRR